jgi:hypothetical protein
MQIILLELFHNIKKIIRIAKRGPDILMERVVSAANCQNISTSTKICAALALQDTFLTPKVSYVWFLIQNIKQIWMLETFTIMETLNN